MSWKLPRATIVAIFVTVALCLTYFSHDKFARRPSGPVEPVVEVPRFELWGIRDLTELIEVSNIRVRPSFQDGELPIKQRTNLEIPFTEINLTEPIPILESSVAHITASTHTVPDASSLIIGLSTQLGRLRGALPSFNHWASGTNARFVILVTPQQPDEPSMAEIEKLYTDHNIGITLIETTANWYDSYVSLLAVLHDHADSTTKWVGIMDDDTYIFSMKRILDMLGRYDANQPYYIGGVSENKETYTRLGLLAYGGGGMFMSIPLLKELRPHVEKCIQMPDDAGDIRISRCIYTYSTTKLTWEHYLFQMDIHGDMSGFYEAARTRPLSTHHWNSWHHNDMVMVGTVGKICGNECVLQKYITPEGWMLTNGFSIIKYSYSKEEEEQWIEGAMEHTWADTAWVIPTSWNYTLAPLKPKDQGKIQYMIEKVDEDDDVMTIYYVRRRDGLGRGIIRMMWEKIKHDSP